MIQVSASLTNQDVFETPSDGIYVLSFVGGSAQLACQAPGDSSRDLVMPAFQESAGQTAVVYTIVTYILGGTKVQHRGQAGNLAGVRLGDEL